MSWRHNSNGYPYICDHVGHVPNTPDTARRWIITEFEMAATKPKVEELLNGGGWRRDSNVYLTFSAIPDSDMTLSTLSDVGRLPKFKMAAIETGSGGRHREFR